VRRDLCHSGARASCANASYGLGENIVQGAVNPDEYMVFKPTLKQGFRPVISKVVGTKETKLVYDIGGLRSTKTVPVPPSERIKFALTDEELLALAR
jgi:pyruvate, water dikinase